MMFDKTQGSSVEFDETGIRIQWPDAKSPAAEVLWGRIEKVIAYKKDCFAVDQLRLEFLADGHDSILVTEETRGWSELVSRLPDRREKFPIYEEWFRKVAFPPFQRNMIVLYERNSGTI